MNHKIQKFCDSWAFALGIWAALIAYAIGGAQ